MHSNIPSRLLSLYRYSISRRLNLAFSSSIAFSFALAVYVKEVLIPETASGTAAILDKLITHRNKQAAAALGT